MLSLNQNRFIVTKLQANHNSFSRAIFLGVFCPRGLLSGELLSGTALVRVGLLSGGMVWYTRV